MSGSLTQVCVSGGWSGRDTQWAGGAPDGRGLTTGEYHEYWPLRKSEICLDNRTQGSGQGHHIHIVFG